MEDWKEIKFAEGEGGGKGGGEPVQIKTFKQPDVGTNVRYNIFNYLSIHKSNSWQLQSKQKNWN